MFKKISALLCLTLSIVLFCTAVFATETETESESTETVDIDAIYVSEDGTEDISAPVVATLTEAYSMLGNEGTIYLMDTVEVSATEGDCFIAPAHTGKITITSADGYDGVLDLTAIKHIHFGGETEWNNIGVIANDVVLTADNNTVTMGEGLTVSSHSDDTYYRGGHTYCAARIHLAAYAPCETANVTCDTAAGKLYVHSGEYWSVSSWYGGAVTVSGGKTQIFLGKRTENDSIWVRYLCPGLYGVTMDEPLKASNSTVVVTADAGLNTAEPYRFTQNSFSGSMTVNWLLRESMQGSATALVAQDFYPASKAKCSLYVSTDHSSETAKKCAELFVRGIMSSYSGDYYGDAQFFTSDHTHELYTRYDGRILCGTCEYEECRHLTSEIETTLVPNCVEKGEQRYRCTDICGNLFGDVMYVARDRDVHIRNYIKTTYDPANDRMGARCLGCNTLFSYIDGMPSADVYVAQNVGTPISISNIREHFASSDARIGTIEHPFEDLSDAFRYAAVAAKQHYDVTIHILDDAYVPEDYWMPSINGHVTVTGGNLHFCGDKRIFKLNGNVTFEHITFMSDGSEEDDVYIVARNYNLVMGEGINSYDMALYVIGGFMGKHSYTMDTNITIRSGCYRYVGGWNFNSSTNDGCSVITVGKTNTNDILSIQYLCPFSRGDGYITSTAESTMIIDGYADISYFYVTTLNLATQDIPYVTNIVFKGDLYWIWFDIRATSNNSFFPETIINLYIDNRSNDAVMASYRFLGNTEAGVSKDKTLNTINATINSYTYEDYCANILGGHADADEDGLCDECGHNMSETE